MSDYFNTTRGPLAATLNDGSSLSMPPKRWIYIKPELESSSSVAKLIEKGFLVKAKVPITIVPDPTPAPVAAAAIPAPAPSAPPKVEETDASASTSPMKEEIRSKKR